MSITKTRLYTFIDKKAEKLRTDIREKYQKISETITKSALEHFRPFLDDLEKHYAAIALKGEDLHSLLQYHSKWPSQMFRDFTNKASLESAIKDAIGGMYYIHIVSRELYVSEVFPSKVNAVRSTYNKSLINFNKELDEVNTLAAELKNIVRQSTSGKKALENLEKAGLDMTGFKAEVPQNLPAVITTSIDVNLFNKGEV